MPTFDWQWNGTHTFSWRTKYACPRGLPLGAPGPRPEEPDPDPPASPPVDPDADVEEREPQSRPASYSILYILFWVSLCLLALRIFHPSISRWSRRLSLCFSTAKPRSKVFRPPASILVRWAAEESPEEYEIDATEGIMHSLSDGEETPLTPDSRATFMKGQYGSAG